MVGVSPVSPVVPLIIDLLERAPAASPFVPVACQSGPMDPPRSRDTKSVISVVQGFHEEVRSMPGVCESHYVAGPPNFRRLGPCDSVSDLRTSAKLGTPEAFSHLREQFLATFGNVVASTFSLRLLSDGLKLNVKKTESLTPNVTYSGSIKVKSIELPRTAVLGSAVASDGKLMVEVNPRVSAAWSKWRSLTGVLCDKIPERFKSKIYRAVVRPIAVYGAECWPVTKEFETSLSVMETKMLHWTAGVMRMASETMSFGRSSVSRI
ncbi:unnamed protein product [Heligmosomoides polygyrus]|uniref:Reverse transcriptase domain-containing protein n=1 Tax=Heligmosomoides polygyrus TaxID=6339 RepID=A0A183G101_HELPZ|nr:unnamed protein product [Heligmosomoides polygyrus]